MDVQNPPLPNHMSRRTLNKTLAWTAPVVTAALAAPHAVASPSPFGAIVAVPWDNTFNSGLFTGSSSVLQPWVIYPTSRTPGTYAVTNSTASTAVGDPLLGNSSAFPSIYPTTGTSYNGNAAEHPDGVGKGAVITISIVALSGSVVYGNQPRSSTSSTNNNAWPSIAMRDYRPNAPDNYYDYIAVDTYSANGTTIGRGVEEFTGVPNATTSPTRWDWKIHLTNPVDNQHDGSDAVTFDIRFPVISGNLREQFKVTVTSPWGTITYTSPAV